LQALVLTGMSTGQVSEMAKELDEVVTGFRNRPKVLGLGSLTKAASEGRPSCVA